MKASIFAGLLAALSAASEGYRLPAACNSDRIYSRYGNLGHGGYGGYGGGGYGGCAGHGLGGYGGYNGYADRLYGGYGGRGLGGYGGNGVGYGVYDGGYGNRYGRVGGHGLNNAYGVDGGYGGYGGYGAAGNDYGLDNGYYVITPGPVQQVPIGLRKFGSPFKPANAKCYGPWCKTQRLEDETFEQTVIRDTENVWIIAYIDPACGECKKFAIEWERLRTVETIKYRKIRLGYVDITLENSRKVVGQYTAGKDVKYTPSVFIYGHDKRNPVEIKGNLSAKSLEGVVCKTCDKGEKTIGSVNGLKIVGATKIQNKSVLGKSKYSLNGKDTPIKYSHADNYYDDYKRGSGAWKAGGAGKADQGAYARGASGQKAGGRRYRDAGANAHGYADAGAAKAGYWKAGAGDYDGHDSAHYGRGADAYAAKGYSDGGAGGYGGAYAHGDGGAYRDKGHGSRAYYDDGAHGYGGWGKNAYEDDDGYDYGYDW